MATLAHLTAVFTINNGKQATINLDFESNVALTQANLQDAADAAADGWTGTPNLRASFPDSILFHHAECYAYDIVANPSPPPPFQRVPVLNKAISPIINSGGVVLQQALPPQIAEVVTFRTAVGGRQFIGRCYLPPLGTASDAGDGTILGTADTALTTRFNDWVVGIQNSVTIPQTLVHVVVSLTGNSAEPVTARELRSRFDVQRRRALRELV
jgi:hypothetical protein